MDEIEARLAALELLEIERLALQPKRVLDALHRAISEGLAWNIAADERAIRTQALQHIEDAERRRLPFIGGEPAQND
jgi:hypothetical protein